MSFFLFEYNGKKKEEGDDTMPAAFPRTKGLPVRPPRSRSLMPMQDDPNRMAPTVPPEGTNNGQRSGRYSGMRPYPSEPAPKRADKTSRRFVQLVCCLVIFGLALMIKLVSPDSALVMKQALAKNIGSGLDYKAVFATMGDTLASGGNIVAVFQVLKTELFGTKDVSDVSAPSVQEEVKDAAQIEEEQPFGPYKPTENGTADDPITEEEALSAFVPIPASSTSDKASGSSAVFLSNWDVFLSAEDSMDDTPPVPFGVDIPAKADYTYYPISFSHATPVAGVLSSDFGYRVHPVSGDERFHYGLDIAAPSGTDIHCFADGIIEAVGVSETFGNYLQVEHEDGISSFYAHCSRLLAEKGQKVKEGDVIAKVGMTGTATGPHLHFEILRNGVNLVPRRYIETTSGL
jgi:murein DD-endopeptidase MepM/ murein hydrolase activator NlpD